MDTKAPFITVSLSSVNVIGGQEVALETSELKIGTKTVATWKDDVSTTCKAGLELDGKAISSGTKLSDPGKLKLTVTDEAGKSSSAEITLTKTDSQAPAIEIKISEKNGEIIATYKDKNGTSVTQRFTYDKEKKNNYNGQSTSSNWLVISTVSGGKTEVPYYTGNGKTIKLDSSNGRYYYKQGNKTYYVDIKQYANGVYYYTSPNSGNNHTLTQKFETVDLII